MAPQKCLWFGMLDQMSLEKCSSAIKPLFISSARPPSLFNAVRDTMKEPGLQKES